MTTLLQCNCLYYTLIHCFIAGRNCNFLLHLYYNVLFYCTPSTICNKNIVFAHLIQYVIKILCFISRLMLGFRLRLRLRLRLRDQFRLQPPWLWANLRHRFTQYPSDGWRRRGAASPFITWILRLNLGLRLVPKPRRKLIFE